MDLSKTTETRKTTDVEISLTGADIVEMLVKAGVVPEQCDSSSAIFNVPGGGDWSYMDIDIDSNNPIKVIYQIVETE